MKFSFVIPTYNKKKLLRRTLESLNHQRGYGENDYEVIVVDDGSRDDVFDYIKGVNTTYRLNYIYLDRCPQSCRSRSRNYGIEAARGRYIAFIDDDIVVNTDYLYQLDRYYRDNGDIVVIGTRVNCPVDLLDRLDPAAIKRMAFSEGHVADMLEERHLAFNSLSYNLSSQKYPWMMTVTCNLSVPRQLLTQIGGFDEKFNKWGYEDLELGYRLHKAGARFMVNGNLLGFHQDHPVAAEGANNYDYFVQCCQEVFQQIDPVTLLTLYSLNSNSPATLRKFRKYQGHIREKQTVELHHEDQLEAVKQQILDLLEIKGIQVTVLDYAENTGLDVWVQSLEVEEAVLFYVPQSMAISKKAAAKRLNILVAQKAARAA